MEKRERRPPQVPTPPRIPDELGSVELGTVLQDQRTDGADVRGVCTGETFEMLDVSESRFSTSVLQGMEIRELMLTDVVLDGCDLSGSLLRGAALCRVIFRDCRMSGVVFDGSVLRDVSFLSCKLDTASLRSIDAQRVSFEDSVMRDADLSSAKLPSARFSACDLRGARFTKVDARLARFHGSNLAGVRGADSLRGVVVSDDEVPDIAAALLDALGITVEPVSGADPDSR